MQRGSGDAPAPKLRLKLPTSLSKPSSSSDTKPAPTTSSGANPTLKFKLSIPVGVSNKPAPTTTLTHSPLRVPSSHASQPPNASSRPITSRSPSPPLLPRTRSPYDPNPRSASAPRPGTNSPYSQHETRSHGQTYSPLSTSTSPAVQSPYQLNAQTHTRQTRCSNPPTASNSGMPYKAGTRSLDNSPTSSALRQQRPAARGAGGGSNGAMHQERAQAHGGTPPQSTASRPPISRPAGMTRSHSQTFSGSRDGVPGGREEQARDAPTSGVSVQPKIILRPGVIKPEVKQEAGIKQERGVKIEQGVKQEYGVKLELGVKQEVVIKQEPEGSLVKSVGPRLIIKSSSFVTSDSAAEEGGGRKHKKHKKEKKEKKEKEKDRDKEKKKQQGSVISSASRFTLSGSTPTNKQSQYDSDFDSDFDDSPANNEVAYCIFGTADFSRLKLKPDHANRPLWITPDGRIFLETYSPIYKQAYDFLIAISEPQCRPENVHEYQLTPHSLYAAVSVGLDTQTIIDVLGRLSKVDLSKDIIKFIRESTENYGKVKLLLKHNRFYVESKSEPILQMLKRDSVIAQAVAHENHSSEGKDIGKDGHAFEREVAAGLAEDALDADPEQIFHSFEIQPQLVEKVKERCLPGAGGLNYPMLEEYDFRNDRTMADLDAELKPHVKLRPYQDKSLTKMFGNGRARSGIIVLPCGAGKSLVGVAAAIRVRKSCLCLCTSSVSVDQWQYQFKLWTTLKETQVARFTSEHREMFEGESGIMVTTFTMVAYTGKRNPAAEEVFQQICSREWGLLLLDEVHVVPAAMFRKVISIIRAHCKLGLTATLLREDERISDLNFLIGPKMYEANWLDLTRAGHIANVQCAEVWCPMAPGFFQEYLAQSSIPKKQLLYVMNPNKFMACEFLVRFHEKRGDKIIVFSDNIFALQTYAIKLGKPYIYGPTTHHERTSILHQFKHSKQQNVVFLSKVGDTSIDIPEANVLIQISSHAGSRRQEAQRLGRILRAKKDKTQPLDEPNAFFYTLVSRDTQEMFFSAKRQQFLIDQGYSFKVLDDVLSEARQMGYHLHFSTPQEQKDLLEAVLAAKDDGIERIDGEELDLVQSSGRTALRRQHALAAVERAVGMNLTSHLTGNKRGRKSNLSEKARKMHKTLAKLAPV